MSSQPVCLENGQLPSSKWQCSKLERHFITSKLIIKKKKKVNILKGYSMNQLCQPMQVLKPRINQDNFVII